MNPLKAVVQIGAIAAVSVAATPLVFFFEGWDGAKLFYYSAWSALREIYDECKVSR